MKTSIIIAALFVPFFASASFDTSLSNGMSSTDVQGLQELLISQKCFDHEPTGYFGIITLQAVKCFQAAHGLPQTGYFGVLSRAAANAIIAEATASSTEQAVKETGHAPAPTLGCPAGYSCVALGASVTPDGQIINNNPPANMENQPVAKISFATAESQTGVSPLRYDLDAGTHAVLLYFDLKNQSEAVATIKKISFTFEASEGVKQENTFLSLYVDNNLVSTVRTRDDHAFDGLSIALKPGQSAEGRVYIDTKNVTLPSTVSLYVGSTDVDAGAAEVTGVAETGTVTIGQ